MKFMSISTSTNDQFILDVISKIEAKKELISKYKRSSYNTNMSLSMPDGVTYNLHTINSTALLISIIASLEAMQDQYYKAADKYKSRLGERIPEFKYHNNPVSLWIDDILTKIEDLNHQATKAQLSDLEKKLSQLMSHELKTKTELDKIKDNLKDLL